MAISTDSTCRWNLPHLRNSYVNNYVVAKPTAFCLWSVILALGRTGIHAESANDALICPLTPGRITSR